MSGQTTNLLFNYLGILPWVSLVAGIGGSLHCTLMCGGLVTATCQKSSDIGLYQLGRLLGYLLLGLIGSALGLLFKIELANPKIILIPGIVIGLLFLYWGIQNLRGIKAEVPTPKFYNTLYQRIWINFVTKTESFVRSFLVGLLSIFLPCGLLYGIVLSTVAFESTTYALTSLFFFWLGTLPAMILAPNLFQKLVKPFKKNLPKTYAVSLIIFGLLTIGFRIIKFNEMTNKNINLENKSKLMCH